METFRTYCIRYTMITRHATPILRGIRHGKQTENTIAAGVFRAHLRAPRIGKWRSGLKLSPFRSWFLRAQKKKLKGLTERQMRRNSDRQWLTSPRSHKASTNRLVLLRNLALLVQPNQTKKGLSQRRRRISHTSTSKLFPILRSRWEPRLPCRGPKGACQGRAP